MAKRSNTPIKQRDKWRIRWIDAIGHRRSETYASHDDACFALKRHELFAEEAKRGLRNLSPSLHSFDELSTLWLQEKSHKRSIKTDESLIRCHLGPYFGRTYLHEITAATIYDYRTHCLKLTVNRQEGAKTISKNTVNHHLNLLQSMLNLAKKFGWLTQVPLIEKYKLPATKYRYLTTVEEVRQFMASARGENHQSFLVYLLAIHTGMRIGEIAALRWADIDFTNRLITVQRSYDGPTKGLEVRHIPIQDALLSPLREHRLQTHTKLVFTTHNGKMLSKDSPPFRKALKRVLKRGGFATNYISFHDLRHTFASHWMMNRGDIFKLQKVLGHKDMTMTMRYAHLAPQAFVEDRNRLSGLMPTQSLPLHFHHSSA